MVPAGPGWAQLFTLDNVVSGSVLNAAPTLNLQTVQLNGGASVLRDLVQGQIASGSADVAWYQFTLTSASTVTLTTFDLPGSSFAGVISLYNNDPDALVQNLGADGFTVYANDPLDPIGHRLVDQALGTASGGTSLTWNLAPGTYSVAVSGAGNQYFHPFIADSGLPGSSGVFRLALEADPINVSTPVVLESTPPDQSVLSSSPLVLRVDLNQGIDPNSFVINQPSGNTIQLLYSADGTFAGGGQSIFIQVHFSPPANDPLSPGADELQITPDAPLQNGWYRLFLQGIGTLASPNTDTTIHFRVSNSAGLAGDDTAATAQNLGDLTNSNLVQIASTIGSDPFYSFYDPNNPNPSYANFTYPDNYAGAQVNVYHFRISGPGSYILLSEAFAGRIGSPLDAGLSLFKLQGWSLVLVTANDNTFNGMTALGDNGYSGTPLFTDPFLNAGLTAGDYYLAVSSGPNTPDPTQQRSVGVNGVFDPNLAHSGSSGPNNADLLSIGAYELNIRVAPNPGTPHVVAVTPSPSFVPIASPTQLVIRFDQAMNLQQEAFAAFQFNSASSLSSVWVQGSDGIDYFPRLLSYDPKTFTATFQMLDALPNGLNVLHLSGPHGLTNLGGTPLAGNSLGGDYLDPFIVTGSSGGAGSPVQFMDHEPNNSFAQAQNLGILFPTMQQAGVPIVRDFTHAPPGAVADTADYYSLTVTQARQYTFLLSGSNLPSGLVPQILTSAGTLLSPAIATSAGSVAETIFLQPGAYVLGLGGWTTAQAQSVAYRLYVTIGQIGDNPTPLTVGAAPALSIRLVNCTPTTNVAPNIVLPVGPTGVVPAGLFTTSGLPTLTGLLPNSVLASSAIGGVSNSEGITIAGGHGSSALSGSSLDVLDLILLAQPPNDGTANSNTLSLMKWIQSYTGIASGPLGRLFDWISRFTDIFDVTPSDPNDSAPSMELDGGELESGAGLQARALENDPFANFDGFEDQSWVGAVAALALYRDDDQRRRGNERTAPGRGVAVDPLACA
jgi:hypothetical protein